MDRLLTRKELGTVSVRLGQYIRGVSREYDYLDRVTKTQDVKSIKVVGGWLDALVYDCDTVDWPVELLIAIVEMGSGTWDNGQS